MKYLSKLFNGFGTIAVAVRITIVYAILGALWIAYSDKLLITLFDPETINHYALLQTYKGWFFILMTSILLLFLIAGNIKKLKRSEELRYETESRYRTIFENSGTAMAILDEDMNILLVNEKFSGLSGFKKKEIEGRRKWKDFIHLEDLPKMIEYLRGNNEINTDTHTGYEFRFLDKQNRIHFVLIDISRIPDTRQHIVSINDITEKKELETKYLRAQRMESIGTLSGGVAHDLNNILAPILLGVESLRKSIGDKRNERVLSIIETSAKRGTDLVQQILTFSRGIHGEHISLQPKYAIREIVDIIGATFPKTIQLKANVAHDLRHIAGNATQIHQALLNICLNARDAMTEGGTLTIEAENIDVHRGNAVNHPGVEPGSYVAFAISDTGSGISDEIKEKLFHPFFTTKDEGKGTGLGLPTVEFILRNHNGHIKVDSTPGTGSTFSLYFPVSGVPVTEDTTKPAQLPMGAGQQLLVIDDEAAICEMISEILHAYNYDVIIAKNGAEGLATYKKYKDTIDLVLTDSNMPLLGGEQLITALREANPNVKIFITTGSNDMKEQLRHLHPPIVGYLQKPYSTHSLLRQLHELLGSKQ